MARYSPVLTCVLAALLCRAQSPNQTSNLAAILSFETGHPGAAPGGWGIGPAGSVHVDDQIVHGGKWSARIERARKTPPAACPESVRPTIAGIREGRDEVLEEAVRQILGPQMKQ